MNVCHVITRLIIGGAQENTVLTCRGLTERGHRVTLIAGPETGPEGSLWEQASAAGCDLIRLDALRRAVHPIRDGRVQRELHGLFARLAPDVVHTHSSKAGILGRRAAASARVPIVVHTIHGMSFNRTQSAMTRTVYRWVERRAALETTALVTVADALIEQAVSAGLAPREKFTTIRSGMETESFAPQPQLRRQVREQWGVAADEVVVGTIARLFENKGYEEIIAAMPAAVVNASRLRFVWVGNGAHRRRYERQLERAGMRDRVHLAGLASPNEVPKLINGFDIVLHASRWEGLPRALVQGLLTEVPAVAFDNDGAPEVVIPGKTGVLVPFGDTAALSRAIVTLAADPGLRRSLGRTGRARCLSMFDWRDMVAQVEALYERLVQT